MKSIRKENGEVRYEGSILEPHREENLNKNSESEERKENGMKKRNHTREKVQFICA